MERIVILKGDALASFFFFMEAITTGRERVYQLRVTVDESTVKLKANSSTWTPGYGELDPECRAAQSAGNYGPGQPRQRRTLTNTGHGHVRPRLDGAKARCSGPGICAECSQEEVQRLRDDSPEIRDLFPVDPPAAPGHMNQGPGGASCGA